MYIFIKEKKNDEELINNIDRPNWQKWIIIKYKRLFNKITIKRIDNTHYLYILPKLMNADEINKIMKSNSNKKIILSKELKEKYIKELELKQEKSIKYFLYNILKYISNKMYTELESQNLYIIVNEYNDINLNIIKDLLGKVKTLTIVTDNIKRYSILEDKLYNEKGILITITNNKNKALKKAEFIINLDCNNEIINKYKINRNAVIINCIDEKINILYFQGIIVNNIEISFEDKKEYSFLNEEFDTLDIYNSFEIINLKYEDVINKIKQNRVEVKVLIGSNGKIRKKELENIKKILTNQKN